MGFPGALVVKNSPANAGDIRDVGSLPGSGRSPGGGHDSSLQYSCLENPMDRGAWQATVHGVAKSQLKRLSTRTYTHLSPRMLGTYIYVSNIFIRYWWKWGAIGQTAQTFC